MIARRRVGTNEWDVWLNGLMIAGPFDTEDEALEWIKEQTHDRSQG